MANESLFSMCDYKRGQIVGVDEDMGLTIARRGEGERWNSVTFYGLGFRVQRKIVAKYLPIAWSVPLGLYKFVTPPEAE
jgi:hypothetical protein